MSEPPDSFVHGFPFARGVSIRGARGLLPLLVLAVATLALAACAGSGDASPGGTPTGTPTATPAGTPAPQAASGFPLTEVDQGGTEVTFEAAPQRIVSLSPAATEVLFAVGAGDRVVGVDRFSNYPPEVDALPKLEYSSPDPEAVLALEPDLVIMAGRQRDQVEQFRSLGMTVFFAEEPGSIEGVLEQIARFGRFTGDAETANALVADIGERIDAVVSRLDDVEEGPLVFLELTPDLYTTSPNTFQGGFLTLVKARNVADGATSDFPQLSAEAVIEADPDVILLAAIAGESLETVAARPGWSEVTAVVEGRVYPVDDDLISRPGPRIAEAIEMVAALLYPDRFA